MIKVVTVKINVKKILNAFGRMKNAEIRNAQIFKVRNHVYIFFHSFHQLEQQHYVIGQLKANVLMEKMNIIQQKLASLKVLSQRFGKMVNADLVQILQLIARLCQY